MQKVHTPKVQHTHACHLPHIDLTDINWQQSNIQQSVSHNFTFMKCYNFTACVELASMELNGSQKKFKILIPPNFMLLTIEKA